MPSGAWKIATLTQRGEPLHQPTDPQHSRPVDVQDVDFVDTTGAPYVPEEWTDGSYLQPSVASPYVDQTPQDHEFGVGDQPGIDQAQARELAGRAHQVDMGAVAAHHYASARSFDGTYQVRRVENHDLAGDSPQTVEITERTGVGTAHDPDARRSVRIQRWRDRTIDMHRFEPGMRPLAVRNAKPVTTLPEVANRSAWVSPFQGNVIEHADNWQTPQERRTPRSWDDGMTTDGTDQPLAAQSFGLTGWGL